MPVERSRGMKFIYLIFCDVMIASFYFAFILVNCCLLKSGGCRFDLHCLLFK